MEMQPARIANTGVLKIPIKFNNFLCIALKHSLICIHNHKAHVFLRNNKFIQLWLINSGNILQLTDGKKVWLLHAGQCNGSQSKLLTDSPRRGIRQMADNSHTVASVHRLELVQLLFVVDTERRVSVNNLHSLQEQKDNIWRGITNTSWQKFCHVSRNIFIREGLLRRWRSALRTLLWNQLN
jgi:hypothetical protein